MSPSKSHRRGRRERRKRQSSSSSNSSSSSSSSEGGDDPPAQEASAGDGGGRSRSAPRRAGKADEQSCKDGAEPSEQDSGSDGSDSEASSESKTGADPTPPVPAAPPANPAANPAEPPAVAPGPSGPGLGGPVKARQDVPLIVSGCANQTISEIIQGTYYPFSMNHGKVVYKKEEDDEESAGLDVLIYYWDDRDGPELCGWWFGPNTGGEMVWAYHPSRKATTPPAAEWNVPHDGAIDPQFSVTAARFGEVKRPRSDASGLQSAAKEMNVQQDNSQQPPQKQARVDGGGIAPATSIGSGSAPTAAPEAILRVGPSPLGKLDYDDGPGDEQHGTRDGEKLKWEEQLARSRHEGEQGKPDRPPGKEAEGRHHRDDDELLRPEEPQVDDPRKLWDTRQGGEEAPQQDQQMLQPAGGEQALETVPDLPHAEGSAVGTQAFFVTAYKRRREERARAEEERRREGGHEGSRGDEQALPEAAAEEEARDREAEKRRREAERRQRDEERRSREERQKHEEQRRQREEQQRRYDEERHRREAGLPASAPAHAPASVPAPVPDAAPGTVPGGAPGTNPKRPPDPELDLAELEQEEEEDKRILEELKRRADKRRKQQEEYQKKKLAEHSKWQEKDEETHKKGEEQARQQEEEAERARRGEDERRPEQDESQRRREKEKRRKEEEQRRVLEEAHKKAQEERRKSDEEKVRKDQEKKDKVQREGRSRKPEDPRRSGSRKGADSEEKNSKDRTPEIELKSTRQQRAIRAVLSCFQKLSDVSLENFEEVKAEYEQIMRTELPETGAQQDVLKAEANRVFGYARQYVEQIKEQQRSWEELKQKREREERARQEEQRRRLEEEERGRVEEERRRQEEDRKRQEEERRRKEEQQQQRQRERDEEDRRREEEQRRREERPPEVQLSREELRRRKEEERRRHEEDLQRRREERRKRERSELEKEEEKRRADREARRKEEEEKRREQQERNAELERKRAEEERAKREEEAKVRREQQATLAVLRGLQKLSDANPENFESLRAEFEQVMRTELPDTGAQQEMLKQEAERVFGYAQQYVEQVKAQQKQAKAQERLAMELLEELQQRTAQAEAAAERAQAASVPLTAERPSEAKEALRAARVVERASRAALAACSACTDFAELKRPVILEAEALREESAKLLQMAQPRIAAATRLAQEALRHSKAQKDQVARALAPTVFGRKTTDLFKRYDKDGDGFLCRAEVQEFSKREFAFSIPEENLERVFHQLVAPDAVGVELARLQQLKTAIGIARHEDRGRLKKMPPEERKKREEDDAAAHEAIVSEKKRALAKQSEALLAAMKDLDGRVQAMERSVEGLGAANGQLKLKELVARVEAEEATLDAAKSELGTVQQRVKGLRQEVLDVKELMEQMRPELSMLSNCASMYSSRLRKAASMLANSRQVALGKAFEKYENLRLEVAGKLRACIEALGGKAVDLFQVICKNGGDSLTTEDVRFFLTENQCDLEPEKLHRIFAACTKGSILEDEEGYPAAASKDIKVAQEVKEEKVEEQQRQGKDDDAIMEANGETDENPESRDKKVDGGDSTGDKSKDAQDKGDHESSQGKESEGSDHNAQNVQSQSDRESKEGQATQKGEERKEDEESSAHCDKQKMTLGDKDQQQQQQVLRIGREDFMRIIRVYCKVVKEIILSNSLAVENSEQIRQLEVGEVVEVYQGPVVEPSVSVLRVHGRALRDGAVGWATISGNQGATFLVPGGNVMRVLRPTALADELKDAAGTAGPTRTLEEGTVLEVLDWARTSRSALGVTRVRGRVRGDGAVGWATTTDGSGTRYLEAV